MLLKREIFSGQQLTLFASPRSAGQCMEMEGECFPIYDAEKADFSPYTLCIFNTECTISKKLIPCALEAGAYVIDSSSAYRLDAEVPLIVPPVNGSSINLACKLYAHANCIVSPLATVLAPLHTHNPIRRVNVTTYQSTSGAGKLAADQCWEETRALMRGETVQRGHFQRQIGFNVIPQIGEFLDDGMSSEEYKIIHEVKKVVDSEIAITATAVRVPVMIGHAMALSLELSTFFTIGKVIRILEEAPFVRVQKEGYLTPAEVVGSDQVFVGRVRRDSSTARAVHLWLCSDNLRRGAATDSVEIAEELIKKIM